MKFEKLDDNKIKIILTSKDLEKKHIDFHSFMSNSIEAQELFIDMLKAAEKEIGFITNNYNLHIETFATSNRTFIFTITRISQNNIQKKKNLVYRRKFPKTNKELSIYCFNSFDDYCNFCNFLSTKPSLYLGNSSLILYDSKYYLILNSIKMNLINSKHFFTYISEFANLCINSSLLVNIILEHGEKLITYNAISVGINYLK